MLVNFDVPLIDAFGEEFTDFKFVKGEDGKKIKDSTDPTGFKREEFIVNVSVPVVNALYAQLDRDKEIDSKSTIALHCLAQRVKEGGERQYEIDEIVEIKQRVFECPKQPRIIYARVCECIKEEPKKVEA